MRRIVMVLLAAGLLLAAADAQAQTLRMGVKGGIASTTLIGNDVTGPGEEVRSLMGGIAGAFLTVRLGQYFAVQPEVLWARKGARMSLQDEEEPGLSFDADYRADYLEIPLLVQGIFALPGDRVFPRLFVGPSFGYQRSCKVRSEVDNITVEVDCDEDAEVKETDWGAVLGVGTEVDLGRLALVFDLRANIGQTRLDDSVDDLDIRNRALSAMAGVSIPLGRRATAAARR